jgi:hypothetical protein
MSLCRRLNRDVWVPRNHLMDQISLPTVANKRGQLTDQIIEVLQMTDREALQSQEAIDRFLAGYHASMARDIREVHPTETDLHERAPEETRACMQKATLILLIFAMALLIWMPRQVRIENARNDVRGTQIPPGNAGGTDRRGRYLAGFNARRAASGTFDARPDTGRARSVAIRNRKGRS